MNLWIQALCHVVSSFLLFSCTMFSHSWVHLKSTLQNGNLSRLIISNRSLASRLEYSCNDFHLWHPTISQYTNIIPRLLLHRLISLIAMSRIRKHSYKSSIKSQKATHPTPTRHSKKSYSNGAMKPIFSGCKISLAGDFIAEHPGPNSEQQWSYEKIAKWIQVHGGQYAREVDDYTTHLIVTIKEYKKKTVQGMPILAPFLSLYCAWGVES